MPADKSPGIDGFPVEFFIQNWSLVKEDVIAVVKVFFHTDKILKDTSCTTITLIPHSG